MEAKLDRIRRNFLCEGQSKRRKIHPLKSCEVTEPKRDAGLGLGSLERKNWTLLAKWYWRFGKEREALWRKVIESKYGEDKWGWVPKSVPRYQMSGLWGQIARVGNESNCWRKVFAIGVGFLVGEGRRVRF